MTSLDYLSEAYRLDLRIDSKLEQIASLNELAEKCSACRTGNLKRLRGGMHNV